MKFNKPQYLYFFLTMTFLLIASMSYGQDGYVVNTDRPNVTDAVDVLRPGYIQMEAGIGWGNGSDATIDVQTISVPQMSWRFGIVPRLEAHAIVDFLSVNTESPGFNVDLNTTNISLGAKYLLWDQNGFIPKAVVVADIISSSTKLEGVALDDDLQFYGRLVFQNTINDWFSLAYLLGYQDEFSFTINPSFAVGDKITFFLEYYSNLRAEAQVDLPNGMNGGFIFLLSDRVSLDVMGGQVFEEGFNNFFTTVGVGWWVK